MTDADEVDKKAVAAGQHARNALDALGVALAELACVEGTADARTACEVTALRRRLLVLTGHLAYELSPWQEDYE